ncbi:MAG: AraC family transcriptional regulator [Betaproteobacteria bacterium]|nr:AraC family transcriptional regulator [Betaproteobacteria bacterium]
MSILVRAAALTHFFEVARELGLNPLPQLRQVGLSRSLLEDPEQRIPVESVVRLLELAARASRDEQFGLRMAQGRQVADFGVVSLLISHQPTLRDALRATIEYRHLINDSLALQIEDAGAHVILREEVLSGQPARQANELAIGVLMRLCVTVMGEDWRPASVNFTHPAPRDTHMHRRFFGCPVAFDSEFNGLVCRARDLDVPNPAAAPALARYAQRFVDSLPQWGEPSLVQEVRKAIYLMLASGHASSGYVAQTLGLSVRTMQRRLGESGASFGDLLCDVRRELAQRYLENPRHSLIRISQMLGYSSPSAFTRWFVAQFGQAPQRWRTQAGPDDLSSVLGASG